jgi:hypothetical protein
MKLDPSTSQALYRQLACVRNPKGCFTLDTQKAYKIAASKITVAVDREAGHDPTTAQ